MTKKDYAAIAKILASEQQVRFVALRIADYFESQNKAFNRERFLEAAKAK